jgi:PPM family protein phosphatase
MMQDLTQGLSPQAALKTAIAKASAAVTELGLQLNLKTEPPSTTIVCAIAVPPLSDSNSNSTEDTTVYAAWVGDSRAYWLSDTSSIQLTQDHSWMNEVIAAGEMTEAEAEASVNAHAITRWLGADAHSDEDYRHDEPSFATHRVTQPGRLMVCSDGLWNYAPPPTALQDLVTRSPTNRDTIEILQHCLDFALSCGGQDNITIAVLNIPDQ